MTGKLSLNLPRILHDDVRAFAGQRFREISGVGLIALAALAALSLASWSAHDPSLSHATNASVKNWLGYPGAITADLLMQVFGLAALAIVLPIAVWGWRLSTHRPLDRERLRLLLWIAGIISAAMFVSCLAPTRNWPLPTGLGGVVGDSLLRLIAGLAGEPLRGLGRFMVAMVTGGAAFVALMIAIGFGAQDETAEEEEPAEKAAEKPVKERRPSLILGLFGHALLALRTRIVLYFRDRSDHRVASDRAVQRVEPRLNPSAKAAPREEEVDEDDEEDAEQQPTSKQRRKVKVVRYGDDYDPPPLTLLAAPKASDKFAPSVDVIEGTAKGLESVLEDFGVRGEIINARPGPVVTLYELEPAPGIKSSRVISLSDDIARSMSAVSARVAVVPGRNVIGIELPNQRREKVYLREQLAAEDYTQSSARLPLCLGKTIGGEPVIVDLARMPHLLIAGTTGSGKSVAINTMILSLVYRLRPEECRLIMVDPKMLELSVYDGIPHLLAPVVTDPKKAVVALKWTVREMEERYKRMSKLGVRNIDGFNARLLEANQKGEILRRTVQTGFDKESGEAIYEQEILDLEPLPYIVVIVDEMADLMMVAGKDLEGAIQRLAQMARAAGIHVILATQRPSVDVITGTIKANFPTRISFQVTSKIDSRTILGEQGAEQLLGQGDMLYMAGGGRISRIHGPFVADDEVEKVVRHLKAQGSPQYLDAVTQSVEGEDEDNPVFDGTGMGGSDPAGDLYQQAVQIVVRDRKASTSYIQRRLQIGYNRAASLMERMEHESVVGAPNHSGKREILIPEGQEAKY